MLSLFKTVSNATPRIAMMMSKSPTLLVAENSMVSHWSSRKIITVLNYSFF